MIKRSVIDYLENDEIKVTPEGEEWDTGFSLTDLAFRLSMAAQAVAVQAQQNTRIIRPGRRN